MKIIKVKVLESTNSFVSDLLSKDEIKEETLVYAESQTKGRGLGSNSWLSVDYKNLVFSLVIFPNLKVERYFHLSMIVSLAICDYLLLKGVNAQIKWPNDIYVKNKKISGILIENSIYGDSIKSSVLGIGLNLNQDYFPAELPNPVSLKNITGIEYKVEEEIEVIGRIIQDKTSLLKHKSFEEIHEYYLEKLYKFNMLSEYKVNDRIFSAQIIDVKEDGHLVVKDSFGLVSEYYFKEIEFV